MNLTEAHFNPVAGHLVDTLVERIKYKTRSY